MQPSTGEIETALRTAKKVLPLAQYLVLEQAMRDAGMIEKSVPISLEDIIGIPVPGPVGAKVAFVGVNPSRIDSVRKSALTGAVGATFNERYLAPLGLLRKDVAILNLVPMYLPNDKGRVREPTETEILFWQPWVTSELERIKPTHVIALGSVAKEALGKTAAFMLPHPDRIHYVGDSRGELSRKLRQIKGQLDAAPTTDGYSLQLVKAASELLSKTRTPASADSQSGGIERVTVPIIKGIGDKHTVYGVVLSPYTIDSQNDFTSTAEIEKTAHDWMAKSRVVNLDHRDEANAYPVESFVEQYPSSEDYANALAGKPHKAFRRKFGNDVIHSGDWVLGTKLDEKLWKQFESGDINAYSIEGFGVRTPIAMSALPKVQFVDLVSTEGDITWQPANGTSPNLQM